MVKFRKKTHRKLNKKSKRSIKGGTKYNCFEAPGQRKRQQPPSRISLRAQDMFPPDSNETFNQGLSSASHRKQSERYGPAKKISGLKANIDGPKSKHYTDTNEQDLRNALDTLPFLTSPTTSDGPRGEFLAGPLLGANDFLDESPLGSGLHGGPLDMSVAASPPTSKAIKRSRGATKEKTTSSASSASSNSSVNSANSGISGISDTTRPIKKKINANATPPGSPPRGSPPRGSPYPGGLDTFGYHHGGRRKNKKKKTRNARASKKNKKKKTRNARGIIDDLRTLCTTGRCGSPRPQRPTLRELALTIEQNMIDDFNTKSPEETLTANDRRNIKALANQEAESRVNTSSRGASKKNKKNKKRNL